MEDKDLDATIARAEAFAAAGDFEASRTLFTRVTVDFPDVAKAWKGLGVAENKLGAPEEAERHLLRALELDSSDATRGPRSEVSTLLPDVPMRRWHVTSTHWP
jgi:Flp pilus assembly protein TadD